MRRQFRRFFSLEPRLLKPGAPRVWDENPDNVSHIFETGNKAIRKLVIVTDLPAADETAAEVPVRYAGPCGDRPCNITV